MSNWRFLYTIIMRCVQVCIFVCMQAVIGKFLKRSLCVYVGLIRSHNKAFFIKRLFFSRLKSNDNIVTGNGERVKYTESLWLIITQRTLRRKFYTRIKGRLKKYERFKYTVIRKKVIHLIKEVNLVYRTTENHHT